MPTETLKRKKGRALKEAQPQNSLRAVRLHLKLTLEQAQERTGVPFQSLSQYETGVHEPMLSRMRKISLGYKVPLENLLDPNFDPTTFFSK